MTEENETKTPAKAGRKPILKEEVFAYLDENPMATTAMLMSHLKEHHEDLPSRMTIYNHQNAHSTGGCKARSEAREAAILEFYERNQWLVTFEDVVVHMWNTYGVVLETKNIHTLHRRFKPKYAAMPAELDLEMVDLIHKHLTEYRSGVEAVAYEYLYCEHNIPEGLGRKLVRYVKKLHNQRHPRWN